jgi:hypothetical protein
MSGRRSRNKGARGELELCRLLSEELGIEIRRNIGQARSGGADCLELQGFAIEVKRCEQLRKPTWWGQAVEQGQRAGAEPMVFFRRNGEPWQALIRTVDGGYREAAWPAAIYHIREKWARWP